MRILIADDDRDLAEAVSWYLGAEGWNVEVIGDWGPLRESIEQGSVEFVVLSVGVADPAGLQALCSRRAASGRPWLVLTATRAQLSDPALREIVADELVIKPIGAMELSARVRQLLLRNRLQPAARSLREGLHLDLENREARLGTEAVPLTALEFELLVALMADEAAPVSRDRLAEAIWGENHYGDLRLVDNHICNLRSKLHAAGLEVVPIATVRGVGYMYDAGGRREG